MKRIKLIYLMLGVISATSGLAQTYTMEGCVLDEIGKPLNVADVLLLTASDSTYLEGTMPNENGFFTLTGPKGSYILNIRLLGYKPIYLSVHLQKDINVGPISLVPDGKMLGVIDVVGSKPIITRSIDRLIFDASASSAISGGNMMDLLRDVPGLIVGQESIGIIGKGQVKVYINDRESKLSGKDLITHLQTYSATDAGKIEVITTPPAKYDAEGNAGIINIRLKEKRKDYVGGNLSSWFIGSEYDCRGYSGASVNFNKAKLTAFLNGGTSYGPSGYTESSQTFFAEYTLKSNSDVTYKMPGFNFEGGMDYAINPKCWIGVQAKYVSASPFSETTNTTGFYVAEVADSILNMRETNDISRRTKNVNFHFDQQFTKPEQKMTFDVDYLGYSRSESTLLSTHMLYPDGNRVPAARMDNNQKKNADVFLTQLDVTLPYASFKINTGAKISLAKTDNQIDYIHADLIDIQKDRFIYDENIYAVYADYERELGTKMSLKAGLRMEHTRANGHSESMNLDNVVEYTRFFPTLYFQYKPSDKHAWNINFSNRISRPAANMINPFVMYYNKYMYFKGKADLQPYYTYNTELNYTFKNNLNFSLYYSIADNQFSQLSNVDSATHVTFTEWNNFYATKTFGINNSYTFRTNFLQSYVQHGIYYQKSTSNSTYTPPSIQGWNYFITLRNTLYFNRKKTFSGNLSGSYRSREYWGVSAYNANYHINAGLKYNLLDNKLSISLNMYNILYTRMKGEVYSNQILSKIDNQFSVTMLHVGVSYNFGTDIAGKKREYSSSEVQRRL